jgi:predicted nucleic-acid-binding protein
MRGLDTNVLVRFLLRDDPKQAAAAKAVIDRASFAGEPLVVSLVTLLETEWVLRSNAGLEKSEVLHIFKQLLVKSDVIFESENSFDQALLGYENSAADFAECLMIAQYQRLGCNSMLTFDVRAAQLPGGELLEV